MRDAMLTHAAFTRYGGSPAARRIARSCARRHRSSARARGGGRGPVSQTNAMHGGARDACVTAQELLYRSSYFGAAGATSAPQQLLLHSMVPLLLATAYALATTVMSNYGKHYNTINTGFL